MSFLSLFFFHQGRGGVGKSFVLKTIANYINKVAGHKFLKVGAPTGNSAYAVGGSTLHSKLQIPVNHERNNAAPKLEGERLWRLQEEFRGCKLLVIDEKSMISTTRLFQVDQRLKQAFPNKSNLPFGGISLVLMGDFSQLPPVMEKALFDPVQARVESETRGKMLYLLFDKVITLTESKRQLGNEAFKALLDKVADGKLQNEDMKAIKSRSYKQLPVEEQIEFMERAAYICARRIDLIPFNVTRYKALNTPIAVIAAKNTGPGASSASADVAGGLLNYTMLAAGGNVILKTNLWQEAGLTNGRSGICRHIIYKEGRAPPSIPDLVLVEFPHYTGPSLIEDSPQLIPIESMTSRWNSKHVKGGEGACSRTQLPLVPGDAMTIHVVQGETVPKAILNLGPKEFSVGLSYTGMSRVRALEDLCFYEEAPSFPRLTGFNTHKAFINKIKEDKRLDALEKVFLEQVKNLPKKDYTTDIFAPEEPMDVDDASLTQMFEEIENLLTLVTTHDGLQMLLNQITSQDMEELIPEECLETLKKDLKYAKFKSVLEQIDLKLLRSIGEFYQVPLDRSREKGAISKLEHLGQHYGHLIRDYLRFIRITRVAEPKALEAKFSTMERAALLEEGTAEGLNFRGYQRATTIIKKLVEVKVNKKLTFASYLEEIKALRSKISDAMNLTTEALASTILGSILTEANIKTFPAQESSNMRPQDQLMSKREQVEERLQNTDREELENAMAYLLEEKVPACCKDEDLKSFLLENYLYSYVYFFADKDLFRKNL